jgi:hypothetical protein
VGSGLSSGAWLWILLAAFLGRVAGQVVVVLFRPRWLPPMPQWYSGLLPYRYLLPVQIVFLAVMAAMAFDVSNGYGFFARPNPGLGRQLMLWSYVYGGSMIVRYAIRMWTRPDQRWLGGTIPIVFHIVLAAFLWVFGDWHATR